jgi:predicted amidophosphoribosyltransferase
MDKTCLDCDQPVSARRRRCPDCRSKAHALWKREKRAAEREENYDSHATESHGDVVDYTAPHSASRPPQFPGIRP